MKDIRDLLDTSVCYHRLGILIYMLYPIEDSFLLCFVGFFILIVKGAKI